MFKKFTNLVLALAVATSVASGMPMHSGGTEAGMMDCCKKALEQNDSPQVSAARLCCAMNCNQPGSTSISSQSFSQTGSTPTGFVTLALPPASSPKALRGCYAHQVSTSSKPAYILNLALLI